mmetsp:Transcript_5700/g.13923  ORF Transcript_5700/g.13923 Transcript_5700/m.13923 type:complete len:459 (-) Transcript_5700:1346-2722(-)
MAWFGCRGRHKTTTAAAAARDHNGTTRTPTGPVFYDPRNLGTILVQCHGSTWPRVLPWCISNVFLLVALNGFEARTGGVAAWTLFFLPPGDEDEDEGTTVREATVSAPAAPAILPFASLGVAVSFLLVTRIASALDRYFESLSLLGTVLDGTRDLVQKAIVFSRRDPCTKNNDRASREWRSEVAYRCLLMAKTTASTVEFPGSKIASYEIPELGGQELEFCTPDGAFPRHAGIPRSRGLDSLRVPFRVVQLLRETICGQGERLAKPMSTVHEMNLLASVETFLGGFHGIRNLMLTPVPFSLVQTTHTLSILCACALPFVLLLNHGDPGHDDNDNNNNNNDNRWILGDCFCVFVATYAFVGLAFVSQDLDDPFGDHPCAFDATGYAKFVVDDVVIMIHDADGVEWADALRYKMNENLSEPVDQTTGLLPPSGETDRLLLENPKGCAQLEESASVPKWML